LSGVDKGGKGTHKPKPHDNDKAAHGSDGATERRKGNCRYCGKPGHSAKECRKAKRDRERGVQGGEVANLAKAEEIEKPGLLMTQVCTVVHAAKDAPEEVYLNEERVIPVPSPDGIWYLDSGASSHMTGLREMFTSLDESVHGTVRFGDGSIVIIKGRGTVVFECLTGDHRVLGDVYYIPSLKSNIVSLGQLDENGCKITIEDGVMSILDRPRKVLARVHRTGNRLYTVRLPLATPVNLLAQKDSNGAWLWHGRYGHLHFRALRTLARKGMARGLPEIDHVEEFCDGCTLGKQHRHPFPQASTFRARRALELVHTDLCGPITPLTAGARKYFILVVNDCTRYMWLELLRTKDEALSFFKKVKAAAEAGRECKLLAFCSDRGGEFNSGEFVEFCDANGINHQTTAPYTPQQNGVVERRNQTVVKMARCLLKAMELPGTFWGEAVKTSVYILNRAPSRSLDGVTPYEA
jgi:transposase InsO family protein